MSIDIILVVLCITIMNNNINIFYSLLLFIVYSVTMYIKIYQIVNVSFKI